VYCFFNLRMFVTVFCFSHPTPSAYVSNICAGDLLWIPDSLSRKAAMMSFFCLLFFHSSLSSFMCFSFFILVDDVTSQRRAFGETAAAAASIVPTKDSSYSSSLLLSLASSLPTSQFCEGARLFWAYFSCKCNGRGGKWRSSGLASSFEEV
jgi:hypothetical protein